MSTVDAFVRGTGPQGPTRNRWLGPVIALAILAAVAVVSARPPSTEIAYDPRSTSGTGMAAIVDVLADLDVDVAVVDSLVAARGADTVLVPPLGWRPDEIEALARTGPRVVAVTRPDREAVSTTIALGGIGLVTLDVDCPLLPDVERLRSLEWGAWEQDEAVRVPEVDRCLVAEDAAWLTRLEIGDGEIVALGSMAPLINARLFDSDASLALVRLLAPTGAETVRIVAEPQGPADLTLFDIIDRRWFDAAWLSLAAMAMLALSRGRRLGAPVDEQLPVRVPSGELARAVGDLRHRAGHERASAVTLRDQAVTHLARRLGLPAGSSADDVLIGLQRSGQAATEDEARALGSQMPTDADGLVAHARALAALRRRVAGLGASAAPPPGNTPATDDTPTRDRTDQDRS